MSEFLSVALVCAGTLLARDCSRTNALDVIVAPVRTPLQCMMQAQATTASAGLLEGDSRYLKVTCERRHHDFRMLRRAGYAAAVVLVPRDAI